MSSTPPRKARFIVFEGPEGAGKSTQAKRLAASLPGALLTREPGGTPGGEAVRGALLTTDAKWSPLAESLLLYAARDAHLTEIVVPALKTGRTVVCDRFADSTEAYQVGGGGLDEEVVQALRRWVCTREPDLTLVFDIEAKLGLERAAGRGRADRFEGKGLAYHERVRARFKRIAQRSGAALIDASGTEDEVETRVRRAVTARFPNLLTPGA